MKVLFLLSIMSAIGSTLAEELYPVFGPFAGHSIIFDRCYEQNVIFRVCPRYQCTNINEQCEEYIVDMQTYLDIALNYKMELQQRYCEDCNECISFSGDDDAWEVNEVKCLDMNTEDCSMECENIDNMEANGYLDAAELLECQELEVENSPQAYYSGAFCASNGSRIMIGVFTDDQCTNHDEGMDVEDYLMNEEGYSMELSYHMLKQTWAKNECLTTCLRDDGANNPTHEDYPYEVNQDICNNLYDASIKCSELPDFTGASNNVSITSRNSDTTHMNMICGRVEHPSTEEVFIEGVAEVHNLNEEEPLWLDLYGSSIKFDRCFLDDYGQSFVVLRAYDQSTSSCYGDTYDEYSVWMRTYMDITLRYKKHVQREYCLTCMNEDCETECDNIDNMQSYAGYVDASDFVRCTELERNIYTGDTLYVGAVCASNGTQINIGVFTDYQCMNHDETKNVEDYLKKKEGYSTWFQTTDSMKLSYHLLKQIYAEDECTIPCLESEDDEDGIVLTEACEELSVGATKCSESTDFIQSPGSDTSIARSSNSNVQTTICGEEGKVVNDDAPSEEEDEHEGNIDEDVPGGEDNDEEAKVGTYEDKSSATHVHNCITLMIVLIVSSIYFIVV